MRPGRSHTEKGRDEEKYRSPPVPSERGTVKAARQICGKNTSEPQPEPRIAGSRRAVLRALGGKAS